MNTDTIRKIIENNPKQNQFLLQDLGYFWDKAEADKLMSPLLKEKLLTEWVFIYSENTGETLWAGPPGEMPTRQERRDKINEKDSLFVLFCYVRKPEFTFTRRSFLFLAELLAE